MAALPFSGLVALPVAAITDAGTSFSDVASMVGWGTFAVERLIFGMTLGAGAIAARRLTSSQGDAESTRPAVLV